MSEQREMVPTRRRRPNSPPPAAPLEDDDLLVEILLRLPPQPSSLLRASLVCNRWRRLVSDPAFLRRFRARHRRDSPLLGCFADAINRFFPVTFVPVADPPDRIPAASVSPPFDKGDNCRILGCRHGLVLIINLTRQQFLVWDPVSGDLRRVAVPPEFRNSWSGVVLPAASAAGGFHSIPFQVVLVATDDSCSQIYSSETGEWGNIISTAALPPAKALGIPQIINLGIPGVLIGSSLYCLVYGRWDGILEFDFDKQRFSFVEVPVNMYRDGIHRFWVVPAQGGGLGFLYLSDHNTQLWKRKAGYDGVSGWVLERTIELGKLLSLSSGDDMFSIKITGFAEEHNVIFLWTTDGVFMVHLKSVQFKKLTEKKFFSVYYPFASVYTAGMGIGDGYDGDELWQNV